jgi:type II secretory pathway component GspD/PulD (secretin)
MPFITKLTGGNTTAVAILAGATALAFTFFAPGARAQTSPQDARPCDARPAPPPPAPETVQTFFLKNASEQNDLNDIETDLRNVMPRARIFGIQWQSAVTIKATAEDMETAQKIISELDQPRKLYRLTYTITDIADGKRGGSQHFVLLAAWDQRSMFKQGSRVPIVTGTPDGQAQGSQVQYQDIGLSIEATVSGSPDGLTLRTKVEQSSLADEKAAAGAQDPQIHQTVLQETSELSQGKPLVLGSLDTPGTAGRQEIEVVAELVH